jgi:formylglycine-generating enzyme required for sulfatase activity
MIKKSRYFLCLQLVCWLLLPLRGMAVEGVVVPDMARTGKRIALVIGNDHYQKIKGLENAEADARAMAAALEKAGFDVMLAVDANHKMMQEAVRRFKGKLSGGDEAIFYFSGHGVQLVTGNYLLPVDIMSDSEDQVRDDALPLQRVLDDLQEQKTRFSLAVIDACRDNPFKTGNGRNIGGRGLASTSPATGQMVIYSAGTGQKALDKLSDKDKDPNGLFTRVFLKEMAKPNMPVDQLLRNVRQEVVRLATSVGHDQVPALFDQALGTFYFNQVAVQPDIKPVESVVAPPIVLANVPSSVDKFSLADIKQRQESQVKWQTEMKAAFDQTVALNAAPALQVAAWQMFLAAYSQDNPFSTEDENLRAQAEARKQAAEKQVREGQVVQATLQTVATPVMPNQAIQAATLPETLPPAPVVAPQVTTPAVSATAQTPPVSQVTPASVQGSVAPVIEAAPPPSTIAVVPLPTPAALPDVATPAIESVAAAVTPPVATPPEAQTTPDAAVTPPTPAIVVAMAPTTEVVRTVEATNAQRVIETFRDCPDCVEMVMIPAGSFVMGSPRTEAGRYANEVEHSVTIPQPFALSKYEVTFAEWDACVTEKGCTYHPDDEGWGRGNQPVIQVSWEDAKQYVQWLSQKTGKLYRLPTDQEWEYAARAGTTTPYPWGEQASHNQANYGTEQCCAGFVGDKDVWDGAAPVGSFPANAFGLYDMQGNVWEWIEDCSDASCEKRVLRGGSWNSYPGLLRSANRNENITTKRPANYGFRVARTLP